MVNKRGVDGSRHGAPGSTSAKMYFLRGLEEVIAHPAVTRFLDCIHRDFLPIDVLSPEARNHRREKVTKAQEDNEERLQLALTLNRQQSLVADYQVRLSAIHRNFTSHLEVLQTIIGNLHALQSSPDGDYCTILASLRASMMCAEKFYVYDTEKAVRYFTRVDVRTTLEDNTTVPGRAGGIQKITHRIIHAADAYSRFIEDPDSLSAIQTCIRSLSEDAEQATVVIEALTGFASVIAHIRVKIHELSGT